MSELSAQSQPDYIPPPRVVHRARIWGHVTGIAGFSALLVACMLLDAERSQVSLPWVGTLPELCMLKRTTGLSCPGCGLTRCFVLMGHGHFAEAWAMSPAGTLFFTLAILQIPLQSIQLARTMQGKPDRIGRWCGNAVVLVGMLMIAQWGWRLATAQLPP